MISMEMMGKIRRMYFRDKLSLHEIAKRTGLARNTIRKWVRAPEAKPPVYQRRAIFNKLSPFHATLEQALKADSLRPKQQRRSAKALLAQIKDEGYAGGYSQLTAFIRAWRGEQGKALQAFVPLTFALGEAFQFDWSDEAMVVGGIFYKLQVAHLKLCFSRAFWLKNAVSRRPWGPRSSLYICAISASEVDGSMPESKRNVACRRTCAPIMLTGTATATATAMASGALRNSPATLPATPVAMYGTQLNAAGSHASWRGTPGLPWLIRR